MPVGACEGCDRFFVLPTHLSSASSCPHCRRPLHAATPQAAVSHLQRRDAVAVTPRRPLATRPTPARSPGFDNDGLAVPPPHDGFRTEVLL